MTPPIVLTASAPENLVDVLRRAARSLTDDRSIRDLDTTVSRIVSSAVATVPGAEGGGISRTEGGVVRSSHAAGDGILELDRLQSSLQEGPCVTATGDALESGVVLADDLSGAEATARWPAFAPAAVRAGYRSLMSVPLSVAPTRRSALNLYARSPGVFDAAARTTAGLFGLQAAMLLHGAEHAEQLGNAIASRDVIGQAKGILMERFVVDDDGAFEMLVRSSQDTNMKLVEVARWLAGEAVTRARRGSARP